MKILIVSQVIYPFQSPRSFRTTELAKELSRMGNEVTIYCINDGYNYKVFEKENNLKIKGFKSLKFIKRKPNGGENYSILDKLLIKLFRRILFFPSIEFLYNIPKSLKNEKLYDVLISIAAPHSIHWGCEKALKINPNLAKKWIADCGDPFMGNSFENPPFYFKYFEKKFCKKADYITVPIEEAKKAYYSEFTDKIKVIPQGFDFSNIKLYEGPKVYNQITFAFTGMVYKDLRDPSEFLEYLSTVDLNFKFIVYTKDTLIFPKYKDKLKDKLEIKNYILREELIFELSKLDFLINFNNRESVQLPSKLIDYALTNRPILSIDFNNIDIQLINTFFNGDYSGQTKVNLENYKIKNIANKFVNLVNND